MHREYKDFKANTDDKISSTALRAALSTYYSSLHMFEVGQPADSIEAFSAILECFHFSYLTENRTEDCNGLCLAHKLFKIELIEQLTCLCGSTSEVLPWDYCTFTLQIYINDLILKNNPNAEILSLSGPKYMRKSPTIQSKNTLQSLINAQLMESYIPVCPETKNCKYSKSKRSMHMLNAPNILVISLIWFQNPLATEICKILASIPNKMNSNDFSSSISQEYSIKAIIVYNGSHYLCYIYEDCWYKCDDTLIRVIGLNKDLAEDIVRSLMWPVAVFYDLWDKNFTEVTDLEWMELEKYTILACVDRISTDSLWVCPCGTENNQFLGRCETCYRKKISNDHWICNQCYQLNKPAAFICQNCDFTVIKPTYSSLHQQIKLNDWNSSKKSENSSKSVEKHELKSSKPQRFGSTKENPNSLNWYHKPRPNTNSGILYRPNPESIPYNSTWSTKIQPTQSFRIDNKVLGRTPPWSSGPFKSPSDVKAAKTQFFNHADAVSDDIQRSLTNQTYNRTQISGLSSAPRSLLCLACNSACENSPFCKNCANSHFFCSECQKPYKKNGQRCSCDLKAIKK